jgi:hypothetical protein
MKTQDVGRFRILVVMLLLMAGAAPPAARAARGIPLARDDTLGRPVLQAAGRGQPWVNLHDGLSLPAAYGGEEQLARLLASGQAAPLALAAGDFDGDGTPDVLAGYRAPGGGLLVLYRGNVAALFPHAPEAQRQRAAGTVTTAPFLSPPSWRPVTSITTAAWTRFSRRAERLRSIGCPAMGAAASARRAACPCRVG